MELEGRSRSCTRMQILSIEIVESKGILIDVVVSKTVYDSGFVMVLLIKACYKRTTQRLL